MVCYVMLCYVILCYVMLWYDMVWYGMLCYVMLYHVMLCYVMLCYVMLWYVVLCYVMLCYAMLCCDVVCCAVLCYVMLQHFPKNTCTWMRIDHGSQLLTVQVFRTWMQKPVWTSATRGDCRLKPSRVSLDNAGMQVGSIHVFFGK